MQKKIKKEWLYIPNVIGYFRIIFLFLFLISEDSFYKFLCMLCSLSLDGLDGRMARYLNQSSLFGARLDVIIDICSVGLLTFYVSSLYNNKLASNLFILTGSYEIICHLSILYFFYIKKTLTIGKFQRAPPSLYREELHPTQKDDPIDHKKEISKMGVFSSIFCSKIGLHFFAITQMAYLLLNVHSFDIPHQVLNFLLITYIFGFSFRVLCHLERLYRFVKTSIA